MHRAREINNEPPDKDVTTVDEDRLEEEEEELVGDELEVYELSLNFLITVAAGKKNPCFRGLFVHLKEQLRKSLSHMKIVQFILFE